MSDHTPKAEPNSDFPAHTGLMDRIPGEALHQLSYETLTHQITQLRNHRENSLTYAKTKPARKKKPKAGARSKTNSKSSQVKKATEILNSLSAEEIKKILNS